MKKFINIIALCCLFTACDKTDNAELLESMFLGESTNGKQSQNDYGNIVIDDNIYAQNFQNPQNIKEWTIGSNDQATFSLSGGVYQIQAKKDFYFWQTFDINDSKDFQIEVSMSCNFLSGGTSLGLVFGVNNTRKSFGSFMYSSEIPLYIGHYDGSAWQEWFTKKGSPYDDTNYRISAHLYTIRKTGNKVSFYIDERFLYSTDYNFKINNIGFYLTKGGTIMVDYIWIDYISPISK